MVGERSGFAPTNDGEGRSDNEPDRRCDHEASVLALEQHTRSRERVKPQEAGAHQEGERDEQEANVAAAMRSLTHREG
jgi:hypothetical protein